MNSFLHEKSWFKRYAAMLLLAVLAWPAAQAADKADDILPKVNSILLEANGCSEQFKSELEASGYQVVTNKSLADAIFKIDVQKMNESLGAASRYAVSLRTLDGFELFGQSGSEDSTDHEEVCEDISEDMVEAVVARSSAIP